MSFSINISSFIFAIGILQGLCLSTALFYMQTANKRAMKTLAVIILCFSFRITVQLIETAPLIPIFPYTGITASLDILIAPLLLFYAWFLTDSEKRFKKPDLVHLLPSAICMITLLPFFAMNVEPRIAVYFEGRVSQLLTLITFFRAAVGTLYLSFTLRRLRTLRILCVVDPNGTAQARDSAQLWRLLKRRRVGSLNYV